MTISKHKDVIWAWAERTLADELRAGMPFLRRLGKLQLVGVLERMKDCDPGELAHQLVTTEWGAPVPPLRARYKSLVPPVDQSLERPYLEGKEMRALAFERLPVLLSQKTRKSHGRLCTVIERNGLSLETEIEIHFGADLTYHQTARVLDAPDWDAGRIYDHLSLVGFWGLTSTTVLLPLGREEERLVAFADAIKLSSQVFGEITELYRPGANAESRTG